MPLTIKVIYEVPNLLGDNKYDIRRLTLADDCSYSQLRTTLSQIYTLLPDGFFIKYTDGEGDLVSITSDREFNQAKFEITSEKILRLSISPPEKSGQPFQRQQLPQCNLEPIIQLVANNPQLIQSILPLIFQLFNDPQTVQFFSNFLCQRTSNTIPSLDPQVFQKILSEPTIQQLVGCLPLAQNFIQQFLRQTNVPQSQSNTPSNVAPTSVSTSIPTVVNTPVSTPNLTPISSTPTPLPTPVPIPNLPTIPLAEVSHADVQRSLKMLEDMGFSDVKTNLFLFSQYNGNTQRVIEHLLQH